MPTKYPFDMTFTQWRRTPFRTRHRLLGLMINNHFRYWKSCADARCRRARSCQDYLCYWRRLEKCRSMTRSACAASPRRSPSCCGSAAPRGQKAGCGFDFFLPRENGGGMRPASYE
jgi:hypothetical protein